MVELSRLARTALWTAEMRARESARPDRLFHDPWALALAAADGRVVPSPTGEPVAEPDPSLPVRTRFFDDHLQRIAWSHNVLQVVLLAAGMDSRAYRLDWPPGAWVFELDDPQLLAAKESILAQEGAALRCTRRCIGVDLTLDWAPGLSEIGHRSQAPTVWLLEGLLYYLSPAHRDALLAKLSGVSAPGSWLLLDYVREGHLRSQANACWLAEMAQRSHAWLSGSDDIDRLLGELGWRAEIVEHGAAGADFGRWSLVRDALGAPGPRGRYLVVAQRKQVGS